MSHQVQRSVISGMPVITIHDPTFPVVRFGLALRRGTGYDPPGQSGRLRTLLELMLRGTKSQSREEFNDQLEETGATLYPAATREFAWFRGITLSRHLEATYQLFLEALCNPALAQDELAHLVEETVEELHNVRDDDDIVADIFLRRALYGAHPFARASEGEPEDLETLTTEDLRAYHQEIFYPQNLIMVFSGDISHEAACGRAEELLEALGAQKTPPPPQDLPQAVASQRPTLWLVDRPGRSQTAMRIARLCCSGHDLDALPLWLGMVAFGGTFCSPLTHEVREVRGWSYGASAHINRRSQFAAPWVLRTSPDSPDALDCLALQWQMIQDLEAHGVNPQALTHAKSYLQNRAPFWVADAHDLAGPAVQLELLGLPLQTLFGFEQSILPITHSDVAQAMARQLRATANISVIVGDAASLRGALESHPQLRALAQEPDIQILDFQQSYDQTPRP